MKVICANRFGNLRFSVIIEFAKVDHLLEGLTCDDVWIDFDLYEKLHTSSSPCPMNKILLMYSEASARRLGAWILSYPMATVNVSSIV